VPMKRLIAALGFISIAAVAQEIPRVSMVRLLAAPEKYHGQTIWVSGFLHCKFENSALYLSKAEADHLIDAHALWVRYSANAQRETPDGPKRFPVESSRNCGADRKYVAILGRFDREARGHFGCCAGSLEDVSRIVEHRRVYQ
jgi:hypothetical protein